MVEALIFDVFGTVVDWRTGIAREAGAVFRHRGIDLDPHVFADAWRGEYDPAMARIRDGGRGYIALDILHRENLDTVLARFGLDDLFDEPARNAFTHAWEKLPPWPDSVPGLDRLKARYIIAPCSNGSIALMTRLAKFGGLNWDAILGADIARDYKPRPAVYLTSAAALGLAPEQVMMVAAHNGDLASAREAGLKTAFLPRPAERGPDQTQDLEAESDWDVVAADLTDLAAKLGA
ncbi:MAG: haloacid dehalogenase type II [Alphaproteobacteria bacterium]